MLQKIQVKFFIPRGYVKLVLPKIQFQTKYSLEKPD